LTGTIASLPTLNPPFLHALQASCLAILPSFFL
jgi:hypothetical protein